MKSRTKQLIITFLIPFFILFISFVIGGFMPFGTKDIMTAYGHEKVLSYFFELWDSVHDGRFLFYSTRIGRGYDFSKVITFYLSDPLNFFILIFPRNSIICVLNILFILKCSFSSVFFYFFIEYHKKIIDKFDDKDYFGNILAVSLSVIYSLSGFTLSIGTDITMTSAIMVLPLVLHGLEKLYLERKPLNYLVFFSISILCSFRLSIVLFVFSAIYFVTLKFYNIRHFLVSISYKLIADIFVIGVGSVVIYNNISSEFFRNTYSNEFPIYEVTGSFLKSLLNIYNSSFYSGLIVIILSLCFFFIVRNDLWRNLRLALFLFISYTASFVSTSRFLLNGFSENKTDLCAISFIFLSIILCYETVLFLHKKDKCKILAKAITIVMVGEVVISGCVGLINNGRKSYSYVESESGRIDKCISYLREKDPYAKIRVTSDDVVDADPVGDLILGYKYIVNTSSAVGFDYMETVDGIDVCKSSDGLYEGSIVNSDFLKWEPNDAYPFSSINQLVKNVWNKNDLYVNVEDHVRVVPEYKDKTYKTTSLMYSFDKPGEYYTHLYKKMTYLGKLEPGEEGKATYHVSADDLHDDILSRETVRFNDSLFVELKNELRDEEEKNSLHVSSEKNRFILYRNNLKMVYIILPFSDMSCFSYYSSDLIDTNTKKLYGSDISVISLDSGNKQIVFEYIPHTFYKGLVLSFISLILLGIGYLISRHLTVDISENKTKLELWIHDNKVYLYTLILSILVYFIIIFINHCVPFGNASAVVSDGFVEDYPTNTKLIHNLRSFNMYDVDYTLGIQRGGVGLSSYMIFMNPLRLILVLFPAKYSLLGFNTLYAVEFILLGQAMLVYLIHRPENLKMDKHELKLIPLAICYNLSTFAICYYSFAGFLELALILPFIMLSLERLIYEKKYIFYTLIMSYYMVMGTYFAFLLCIFLFLYFFTMEHENFKRFIKNGIRFAFCSLLSAGVASFTLLSFYTSVANSGYVDNDSVKSETINIFTNNMVMNLSDLQVMHDISNVNGNFTAANSYCGILPILLLPAFLFMSKRNLSYNIRRVLLILLLYFAYGNELLNYVFHGFHFQSFVPNRFSIFFIFLVITTFYEVIIDYRTLYDKKAMIAYSTFSLCLMFISYYMCGGSISNRIINAAFILVYLGVLLDGYIKKKYYSCFRVVLLILCIELGVSTLHTIKYAFREVDIVSNNDINTIFILSNDDKSDDSITRTSVPTQYATNISCVLGINTVDIFTSSLQQEQIDIADAWNMEHGPNYLSYKMGNPLADISLKVKYYYMYDNVVSENIPSFMNTDKTLNSIAKLENAYVPNVGILFPFNVESIKIEDFDNPFEYQNYLSQLLVGEDLYEIIDLVEADPNEEINDNASEDSLYNSYDCIISKAGSSVSFKINKQIGMEDVYIGAANRIVFAKNAKYVDGDVIDGFIVLTDMEASKLEREGFGSISAASLNKDTLELIKEYLNTKCISNLKADNFGISGDITVDYDGYVFIPTFMYDGWKTTVDGTEVKTEKILGGTGIPVTKGKHSIKISKLHQVNMKQYYLTIASLIIFVMIIIVLKMKFSSEKKTKQ